jgi:hypothetical protein
MKFALTFVLYCGCAVCYAAEDAGTAQEAAAPSNFFWDGLAKPAPWGRPFWSDTHSALIRAEIAYASNSPEYNYADLPGDYRPYFFTNIGADVPIWSGNFCNNRFGLKISVPIMVDVWLDFFEKTTSPVINTDYRPGAPEIGFMYRFPNPLNVLRPKWNNIIGDFFSFSLNNIAFRFSPFKHESTHIGDELTIARNDLNMEVTRVNVSYNYAEFQLTINDPEISRKSNHAAKIGLLILWDFDKGWYQMFPAEGNEKVVQPSQSPVEMYFQYQYQTAASRYGFQGIFSVELRLRERYHYPFSYPAGGHYEEAMDLYNAQFANTPFTMRPCVNLTAGIRYINMGQRNYFSKIGLMFHYYKGINPYGQFRSMPRFEQFGLALVFE